MSLTLVTARHMYTSSVSSRPANSAEPKGGKGSLDKKAQSQNLAFNLLNPTQGHFAD
jgi:hypothetical protein